MHRIPEEKHPAVSRALLAAFGAAQFQDIQSLTAGLSSALVFRILVDGTPYLLRVIMRTDAMADPTRQFATMTSGAEIGIAPRVWYTSTEDRVSITDFVNARPFSAAEGLDRLPAVLRTLHALPPFAAPICYLDTMNGFVRKFQASEILPASETRELFEQYARVTGVYPRDGSDMVSCHNDLKPENVLFDGDRFWLVDWEAAFLNDRYADLAVVANFVVSNSQEEELLLRNYFEEEPGEYRSARFYLMRQIMHMFYAAVFLMLGSSGKPIDTTLETPDFVDLHRRILAWEVSMAGPENKVLYGRAHMQQMLHNVRSPRFEDALRIVRR
jgi:aminoglycoside phosphotransferase